MKQLILLISLFSFMQLHGQLSDLDSLEILGGHPSEEHELFISGCQSSGVQSVSFVEFSSDYSLYLEVVDSYKNIYFVNNNVKDISFEYNSNDGIIVLDHLQKEMSYTIRAYNSCGELEPLFTFTTESGKNDMHTEFIPVSRKMFSFLTEFGIQPKEEAIPLSQFLTERRSDIHLYEKLSFYQKKAMKGETFDEVVKSDKIIPMHISVEECSCRILTLTENISPGLYSTPWWNQYVSKVTANVDEEVGSNAKLWGGKTSKGAAKYQDYASTGWKNKPCKNWQGTNIGDDIPEHRFENRSELSLHLLCNDGNELPGRCGCEKRVYFDYQYDTYVSSFAKVLRKSLFCNGKRAAEAVARDMAVVFCTERSTAKAMGEDTLNSLNIIDKLEVSTYASCATKIDKTFFTTWGSFGDVLIKQYKNFKKLKQSGTSNTGTPATKEDEFSLETIGSALDKVYGKTLFDEVDCDNLAIKEGTMSGKLEATLIPNITLTFHIFSHGITKAKGRRSWFSQSLISSDFAMTATVSPGLTTGVNASCCSPWAAIYSGAAYGTPLDGGSLWALMGGMLHELAMDDCYYWENNHPYSYGDYGSCTRPASNKDCPVKVDDPGIPDHGQRIATNSANHDYKLISLQGMTIGINLDNSASLLQTKEHILNSRLHSGVYFLRYYDTGRKEYQVIKLFKP